MTMQNTHHETVEENQARHLDSVCTNESELDHPWWHNFKYLIVGILFGITLVKSEIISWFRIQEMFHLASFHMYGVIGTAVVVGSIGVFIVKKLRLKSMYGEVIHIDNKTFNKGQIIGASLFGIGWAMTGACPGPLYAQIGSGFFAISVTLLSALAGTWVYGALREKLPH
ncbi:MAG: DUF6691 family protein [Candidatus Kapaibacterium sp.]